MELASHKLILFIAALLSIGASLAYATPGWFDYLGKTYHTEIDLEAATKAPIWEVGKKEPPIGANTAYILVNPKLEKSFGKQLKLELKGITLVPISNKITVWAVDFVEVRSEAEIEKALSDDSIELAEVVEIRYYVLMDGSVSEPKVIVAE